MDARNQKAPRDRGIEATRKQRHSKYTIFPSECQTHSGILSPMIFSAARQGLTSVALDLLDLLDDWRWREVGR